MTRTDNQRIDIVYITIIVCKFGYSSAYMYNVEPNLISRPAVEIKKYIHIYKIDKHFVIM